VDILVDTNILVHRIHRGDPQHLQTREALNRLSADGHRLCVTSQNLIELWAVCTRPNDVNGLGLSPAHAERILARVERSLVRLGDSDDVYPEWRKLVALHAVSGKKAHDARLVAAMNVHRITQILTFNVADFARYPRISVIEPSTIAPAV
jgi:predicted nucleic acid-binding protein